MDSSRSEEGRARIFVRAMLAIIVAGFLIGQLARPQSTPYTPRRVGPPPKSQSTDARISIYPKNPTLAGVIRSSEGLDLFHPRTLRTDKQENIYVVDGGDNFVKKFSPEGKFLVRFGKGKGSGPGEFLNPLDFTIDSEMNVWVCDGRTGLVTVFNKDGSLKRTIRINGVPLRIEVFSANQFILMLDGKEDLFARYDSLGHRIFSFGRFIEDQAKYGIVLDGAFVRVHPDGLVFAPYYSGLLTRFTSKGTSDFIIQTIIDTPWPPINVTADGGSSIDHRSVPLAALSLSCSGDTLYLLSRVGPQRSGESRIDAYSSKDGKYFHSIILGQRVRDAIVVGNHIFSLADTTITVWKR